MPDDLPRGGSRFEAVRVGERPEARDLVAAGEGPGSMSTGSRIGIQWRAAIAMSSSGSDGAAKSKSMNATTRPSRTTTFSTHRSLWTRGASEPTSWRFGRSQTASGGTTNEGPASWSARWSRATPMSTASPPTHAGYGGVPTSPSMNVGLRDPAVEPEVSRRAIEPERLEVAQERRDRTR